MNYKVIDFETTGLDPKTCKPVEVATFDGKYFWETLINPKCPIPPETSAVHHIIDEDVIFAPEWGAVKEKLALECTTQPLTVLIAHNAEYEKNVIGDDFPPVLWICTYKVALRVHPNAPSHKNECLRYYLKLGEDRGRNGQVQNPHSAGHDVRITHLIFQELLQHVTMEQMIEWTELPAKLPRMPMGKHFGQTWDTVPAGYLNWCIAQTDMREDVKYCAKEELERRKRRG